MNDLKLNYPLSYAIGKRRRSYFNFDYAAPPDVVWRNERFEILGLPRKCWHVAKSTNFKRDNSRHCWWTKNPRKAAMLLRCASDEAKEKMERMLELLQPLEVTDELL